MRFTLPIPIGSRWSRRSTRGPIPATSNGIRPRKTGPAGIRAAILLPSLCSVAAHRA